jgi:hypothetical protein
MSEHHDPLWTDDDSERLVPLYALTKGRTRPAYRELGVATLVMATPAAAAATTLEPEHRRILELCPTWQAVAEISAHLNVPLAIAKIQLSDLIDLNAVTVSTPTRSSAVSLDAGKLKQLLNGLVNMQ